MDDDESPLRLPTSRFAEPDLPPTDGIQAAGASSLHPAHTPRRPRRAAVVVRGSGPDSGRRAVIEAQQAAQSLAAHDLAGPTQEGRIRLDQLVAERLMVALGVVVRKVSLEDPPQVRLAERNDSGQTEASVHTIAHEADHIERVLRGQTIGPLEERLANVAGDEAVNRFKKLRGRK